MATTQEIIKAAEEVGKMIAAHDSAKKFEAAVQKLQADSDAQRVLNDFNRYLAKMGEKEQQGKPIEVNEKRELEKLQMAVIRNPLLQQFQMAQMDYLDLMRRVDAAIEGSTGVEEPPGAPAPGGKAPGGIVM